MNLLRRFFVVCGAVGIGCLLAGCGPREIRGAKLRGQLVMNGQPVTAKSGERVSVTFERLEPVGKQIVMSAGRLEKDGTFTIEGQLKKGTPAGQYKVTIHAEMSAEGESRFAHLFADGKSPFTADVTDQEDQFFVIDIGAKTITKR